MRQRGVLGAVDVGLGDLHLRRVPRQRDLFGEGAEGVRVELVVGGLGERAVGVVHERLAPDRIGHDHRAVADLGGDLLEQMDVVLRHHVVQRLAVIRHEGVPVDQPPDALRRPVGDPGDHHAAIGVAHQDHVGKVVLRQIVDDRLDGVRKSDRLRIARAVAGERRAMHHVTRRPDRRGRFFQQIARMPGAVDEDVGGHGRLPRVVRLRCRHAMGSSGGWQAAGCRGCSGLECRTGASKVAQVEGMKIRPQFRVSSNERRKNRVKACNKIVCG